MALTDDLQAIEQRANRELDAVHDFFEHSRIVWESFRTFVGQGYTLTAQNPATGSQFDQDGLVRLSAEYTRKYLATFTFRQFVSAFEVFLFDFLQRLLLHNPWQFSKRKLDFTTVLEAGSLEEVISGVVLQQLDELKYKQLREWFVAVNNTVELGCPTDDEVERLAEVKAARDIIEHSASVVNETYRRKAGTKARYQVGETIEIDDNYHLASWRLIKKVVTDVTAAAISKLGKP
jgi:hypothetical protein